MANIASSLYLIQDLSKKIVSSQYNGDEQPKCKCFCVCCSWFYHHGCGQGKPLHGDGRRGWSHQGVGHLRVLHHPARGRVTLAHITT